MPSSVLLLIYSAVFNPSKVQYQLVYVRYILVVVNSQNHKRRKLLIAVVVIYKQIDCYFKNYKKMSSQKLIRLVIFFKINNFKKTNYNNKFKQTIIIKIH